MEWKSASEIIQLLIEQGQALSGMTASEAASALGFKQLSNGMFVKTATTTASNVVNFTGGTAAEAFAAGEATITGGATTTAANLTLIEGGAVGTTSAAGLLSVSIPIALSLITAATGYIIGYNTYMENQELFDSLTGPLMEYCADGTVNLIALVDSLGNTYFDSRAYNKVKNYLDSFQNNYTPIYDSTTLLNSANISISIGVSDALHSMYSKCLANQIINADLTHSEELISMATNYINTNYPNAMCIFTINLGTMIGISVTVLKHSPEFNFKVIKTTNADGYTFIDSDTITLNNFSIANIDTITFYGADVNVETDPYDFINSVTNKHIKLTIITNLNSSYPASSKVTINRAVKTASDVQIIMSNFSISVQSTLPQGVEKFIPNLSELLNPIKLINGFDSSGNPTYTPFYPVGIPVGDPLSLPTIDPLVNPTITTNPEVVTPFIPVVQPYPNGAPALSPSTNPQNSPLPNPVPSTDINPYPAPNPSLDPSLNPTTGGTNPTKLPSPDNEGTSPTPNMPIIPPLSSSANGLLHVYNPTNEQINSFGAWLWTTFSGDLIDTLAKIFNNPMDAVIGLHEIYITPTTASTTTIKAGFLDSGVPSKLVGSRYTEINCGSITVPEYWGNYLDYSPYTKTYCYLPFIGIVELSTDDIVGHGVNITYKIDSFTGSCIAIITVAKTGYDSIVYQYPGNCAVEIPITSGIKGALQSALIGAATSAIAVASGGGAVVATAALAGGAKSGLNSKNEVSHSGSFGSTYGAMGAKKPFIIVKRPNQKVVPGYNTNYGYPAHTMVLISACSGYLRAKEVDIISVTATEEEKKMIETMLKSGIFVS